MHHPFTLPARYQMHGMHAAVILTVKASHIRPTGIVASGFLASLEMTDVKHLLYAASLGRARDASAAVGIATSKIIMTIPVVSHIKPPLLQTL